MRLFHKNACYTTSETYFEIDGSTTTAQFLPLYYDTGKRCLVGYWMNSEETTLVESYWAAEIGDFVIISVEDPSVYGFQVSLGSNRNE